MANPDVFVSYSSEDRARVESFGRKLADGGLNVWWDRDLQVGDRFRDVIQGMLHAARAVVVFWSRSSINSQWVIDEAEEAARRGVLVPARLDQVDAPLGLRGWQYADFFGGDRQSERAFDALFGTINRLLSLGVRPDQRWWAPLADSTTWSISGAATLRQLSLDVRVVAQFLTADPDATAALKTAVNEVYRTYAAVRAAIDEFSAIQGSKGIRQKSLQSIAKGRLAVEVNRNRGHCTAIGLAYFGHPGIRDALVRNQAADLEPLDQAFVQLSSADGDAFEAMTQITTAMTGEAAAIANHLAAGQDAVARERLSEDVAQLSRLEAELSRHMTELLAATGDVGIVIGQGP